MSEPLDVQVIRARADAASPEPWTVDVRESSHLGEKFIAYVDVNCRKSGNRYSDRIGTATVRPEYPFVANGTFMAHARSDVPALCDALDKMRDALTVAAATCSACCGAGIVMDECNEWHPCGACAPFRAALALTTERTSDE